MLSGTARDKLKKTAIDLRKRGYSYPMIENRIKVSRSTLSGWLSTLLLSELAREKIVDRKRKNLQKLRLRAVKVLRNKYEALRLKSTQEVEMEFDSIVFNTYIKEALLAMLYLGEGFKKIRSSVGLGNSSPQIVKIFVQLLREIYKVDEAKLRCYLFLRYNQSVEIETRFWSAQLSIPPSQFRKAHLDKRTLGKKTWPNYHGVCAVYCYSAEIEKRLTALQQVVVKKLLGV